MLQKAVISGSFRKHMQQIGKALENFAAAGVHVLAPATKEVVNPGAEFVILTSDEPNKPPHKLELEFMQAISHADFLSLCAVKPFLFPEGM